MRVISTGELRTIIGEVVAEKLREMFGDPGEGLSLRPELRERLIASLNQPRESRRTVWAPKVARDLGLDW
jgi:hypothetical protein